MSWEIYNIDRGEYITSTTNYGSHSKNDGQYIDFNDFNLIEDYMLELDSNIGSYDALLYNHDGSEITYTKEQYDLESKNKNVTHTILGDFSKLYYGSTVNYTWIYSSDNNGLRELSLVFTRDHSDDYDLKYNSYYVNFDLANQEYTEGIYDPCYYNDIVTKEVYNYTLIVKDAIDTPYYYTITAD